MAAGLRQIPEQPDRHARGRGRAEARRAVGEGGDVVECHIAHVGQDLLPELRLCAAADDAQIVNLLPLAHHVQDLTQPAGRALQNGAEEMLALVRGVHSEEDALRLRVKDRGAFTLEIRQVDEAARARRDRRRGRIERAGRSHVKQLHRPRDRPPRALLRAEDVAAVAVERVDVEDAVLRVDERLFHLPGDPRGGAETEVEIAGLRHARADVGARAVAAADGHRDACPQAEAARRFFGQVARELAARADLGEFFRVHADVPEHIQIVLPRAQVHQQPVRGVGHVGRVHMPGQAVDQIVLRLQDPDGPGVELRLVLLEPEGLAERRGRGEHVAADLIEIIPAVAGAQRVGDGQRAGIRVDHRGAERLPLAVHRQAAEHVARDADGVDPLDVLRRKLAEHHHRADRAHPPVRGLLLAAAVGIVVGRIGGRHVADDIEIFVDQRGLQAAGADIKSQ